MNNLSSIAAELEAARNDVAILERLNSAQDRVTELSQAYEAAQAAAEREEAATAAKAREALFEEFDNLTVTDISPPNTDEGFLHRPYLIEWDGPAFDAWRGGHVKRHAINGFGALPGNVLAYLIEKRPDQIPAGIKELSPDDLYKAFDRYFVAKRRGYTIGNAGQ